MATNYDLFYRKVLVAMFEYGLKGLVTAKKSVIIRNLMFSVIFFEIYTQEVLIKHINFIFEREMSLRMKNETIV